METREDLFATEDERGEKDGTENDFYRLRGAYFH